MLSRLWGLLRAQNTNDTLLPGSRASTSVHFPRLSSPLSPLLPSSLLGLEAKPLAQTVGSQTPGFSPLDTNSSTKESLLGLQSP